MITTWPEADDRMEEIIIALRNVCIQYGVNLFLRAGKTPINVCNQNNTYTLHQWYFDTNLIAKNIQFEAIRIYTHQIEERAKIISDEFIFYGYLCTYFTVPDNAWTKFIIKDDDNPYDVMLKFFKDNNVLTKDEMIIKDIIE